ncbi:MAG: Ig-like domain-containing protein [Bdellovibrionales bacterium]|nr:Ig-like domain-containing protein [Bdellovibrionales bacterium]
MIRLVVFVFLLLGAISCTKKQESLDVQQQGSFKEEPLAFDTANIDPSVTKDTPLKVLMIKPNSDNVAAVQQITVTFNKKMVPLGDFEKLAEGLPIEVKPAVDCKWRWLNSATVACNLNERLPDSREYRVTVSPGIKALDQSELKKEKFDTFSTRRWRVVSVENEFTKPDLLSTYWTFNQPMKVASLKKKMESKCGAIKVEALGEKKAEDLSLDPSRSYKVSYLKPIGLSKDCSIHLDETARAEAGDLNGKFYSHSFKTYGRFRIAELSCGYSNSKSIPEKSKLKEVVFQGCNPDAYFSIELSSPTSGKGIGGSVKVEPQFGWLPGGMGSPEYHAQNPEQEYNHIHLPGPLEGAAEHKISLSGLKDKFGRALEGPSAIKIKTTDFNAQVILPSGYGVIEKEGPWRLAYSGVNVDQIGVNLLHTDKANIEWEEAYKGCPSIYSSETSLFDKVGGEIQKALKTGWQKNYPGTNPIDLKELLKGKKYGVIYGRVFEEPEVKEVSGVLKVEPSVKEDSYSGCSSFTTVVTDLGIMGKIGFYDSAIWVHSIKTAKPEKGVNVAIMQGSKIVAQGVTDDQGHVALDGAKKFDPERNNSWKKDLAIYLIAWTEDDFSMLPFSRGTDGLEYYNFSNWETGNYVSSGKLSESDNSIVHAITDRPLYQPGQKVNLKVFMRHWEPRTFGMKPGKAFELLVKDARGKQVFKSRLELNDFGTANVEFDLDPSASLGSYSVSKQEETDSYPQSIGSFDVQEFTLPSFKVLVDPARKVAKVGKSSGFKISAQYHFGGGVPNSKGSYRAWYRKTSWKPSLTKWTKFIFDDSRSFTIPGYERPSADSYKELSSGDMKTDANGDSFVGFLLSPNAIRAHGEVSFEGSLKDDKGKSIAGTGVTEVYYTSFHAGIRTEKWTYEAGDAIEPEVVLLDPNETPVVGRKVELKLIHRSYYTVRRSGEGSYYGYDTKTKDRVIDSCKFKSGSEPSGCTLTPKAAGSHYILAITKDEKGRVNTTSMSKYVTGKGYVGWRREDHDRIDLETDKKDYKVGETVELLIKNPYKQVDAIITLERFGILKHIRKTLKQGAEIVKIPLDDKTYAPGLHISVHLIQGRTSEKLEGGVDLGKPSFKMGLAAINVLDPDTKLSVEVKSEKEVYEPGQMVNASIQVETGAGTEVTELSVAVVDEKILQLAGPYAGNYNLHKKFYYAPPGDVETAQMLSHIIGRRHFGKKGANPGGDGAEAAMRSNFLPLAYWNPTLKTDSSGKAKIEFKLPDNLTTWRLLVVAVDKSHRFGYDSGTLKVIKKLMIEPALPSFLIEGDKLKSRFVLFNRSGADAKVQSELKAKGMTLEGEPAQVVDVKDGGKGYAEWWMNTMFGESEAEFQVKAAAGADTDGVKLQIPIRPFVSYDTFAIYGSTVKESVTEDLLLPKDLQLERSAFKLAMSPTLIAQLEAPLKYGIEYPYACWEQKLTKAVMLSQYIQLKKYVTGVEPKRNPQDWISELLADMPKHQYSNGAMAYWKPDYRTVDPYLSAYTVMALFWLNQQGVEIPREGYNRVIDYLQGYLSGKEEAPKYYSRKANSTVRAMAAYVLTVVGKEQTETINSLFAERESLSLFAKSFLWMTMKRFGEDDTPANTLKDEIYSLADMTSGKIQFQEGSVDGLQRILHSTTRTNCNLLTAMLEVEPDSQFVQPLVRWIIQGRKTGRWNNTQENLYCLNALVRYAAIYEKDKPDFKAEVAVMKQQKTYEANDFKTEPVIHAVELKKESIGKPEKIEISKKGQGRLYYKAELKTARANPEAKSVNAGLGVKRNYYLKRGRKWQLITGDVKIKRGDLVRIQLKVNSPATRYQVALNDPLPAGLEPLNTALATTSKADLGDGEEESSDSESLFWSEDGNWWVWYFDGGFYHRELRLHAAQYFADFLTSKNYEVNYVAQAIAVGEFTANPAHVEEMYDPEVYGKSEFRKFIIGE